MRALLRFFRLLPAAFDRAHLRRAGTWILRVLTSWVMLTGCLPRPLLLVYLEWLHECLNPQHPAMDLVLVEIATVKERTRA